MDIFPEQIVVLIQVYHSGDTTVMQTSLPIHIQSKC